MHHSLIRRRPEAAVAVDDDGTHLLDGLAFGEHCHHVTRDIDADASAQGVVVEL
jgi:hypothetical protein